MFVGGVESTGQWWSEFSAQGAAGIFPGNNAGSDELAEPSSESRKGKGGSTGRDWLERSNRYQAGTWTGRIFACLKMA
jgi:hypothetical protein